MPVLTAADMPTLLDWAASEGWNPGLNDGDAFFQSDPAGFYAKDIDGSLVSAISVVNHSDTFAFLGLYLCRPEFRGQGHGLDIWQEALHHAGARTVGLDGVPDQQENYRKSGFVLFGQTVRWQGRLATSTHQAHAPRASDRDAIRQWDAAQVGFSRPAFLDAWLADCATRKTLVLTDGARLTAYGTIRRCREGTKIGPFAAENEGSARHLLAALAGVFGSGTDTMIDVPASAPALARLLGSEGFAPGFETARMYKGPPPNEALARFAAVATLELG